jgi:hypothetical protein
MATKKKIIAVPAANVRKLADAHHITQAAVYNMLSFNSNSQLAQLVRKQAVDMYGGVNTTKVYF